MKILFHIYFLTHGGAERVTSIVASELAKRGHEVYIVVTKQTPNDYPVDDKVNIIVIPSVNRLIDLENLRNVLIDIKPDVNIGVLPPYFDMLLVASRGLNIPLVASDHNNFHWAPTYAHEFIKLNLYNYADITTVLTENDKKYMEGKLNNMVVMYNPLSFPIIKKSEEVTRQKKVLCVGRINSAYTKGFDNMLCMWSIIINFHPDWILDIAGTGNEKSFKKLQEMIDINGLSNNVNLIGWKSDMRSLYKEYPIFALPSREEGFPCSLLEAMSQGCVPVSFSIRGNIKEIITDNKDGFIIEDGYMNGFIKKINFLIENEEIRNEMSKNAIKNISRFKPEKITDNWEKMLIELVENYKRN